MDALCMSPLSFWSLHKTASLTSLYFSFKVSVPKVINPQIPMIKLYRIINLLTERYTLLFLGVVQTEPCNLA